MIDVKYWYRIAGEQREEIATLRVERDALLEALLEIGVAPCYCDDDPIPGEDPIRCLGCIARAAIAKVEGDGPKGA